MLAPNAAADKRLRAQLARAEKIGDIAAATMLRARIAADYPAYAATDEGQAALAQAAELARIARYKARVAEAIRQAPDDGKSVCIGMSDVPFVGDWLEGLDPGEREILRYQRESR